MSTSQVLSTVRCRSMGLDRCNERNIKIDILWPVFCWWWCVITDWREWRWKDLSVLEVRSVVGNNWAGPARRLNYFHQINPDPVCSPASVGPTLLQIWQLSQHCSHVMGTPAAVQYSTVQYTVQSWQHQQVTSTTAWVLWPSLAIILQVVFAFVVNIQETDKHCGTVQWLSLRLWLA